MTNTYKKNRFNVMQNISVFVYIVNGWPPHTGEGNVPALFSLLALVSREKSEQRSSSSLLEIQITNLKKSLLLLLGLAQIPSH
jgi:hypothetical protein